MMNRLKTVAAALFLLSGCVTPEVTPGTEGTVVSGTLKPYTKASLDEEGLSLNWTAGDMIGVVTSGNGNNKFTVIDSTLKGSTAKFLSEKKSDGSVSCAYFPYSQGDAIKMKLPSIQTQKESGPDMSLLLCTAGKPSGSDKKVYSFTFSPRWSLVGFIIRSNGRVAGETLKSISLRVDNMPVVTNAALTGEYTLDLTDTEQVVRFTSCVDSVMVVFENSPVLKAGDAIEGWTFINPCKVSGDAMTFRIKTDKTSMIVDSFRTPEGGWTEGRRTVYDFDLAEMEKNGELVYEGEVVPMETQFLKLTEPGAYNMSGSSINPILSHRKGSNQYSHYVSGGLAYGGVTDVAAGAAFKAGVSLNIKEGGTGTVYTAAVALPEVTASDYGKVTCVKRTESAIYLVDNSNRIGYIIPLK